MVFDSCNSFYVTSALGPLQSFDINLVNTINILFFVQNLSRISDSTHFKLSEFFNYGFVGQKVDVLYVVECAVGRASSVYLLFVLWFDWVNALQDAQASIYMIMLENLQINVSTIKQLFT